MLELLLLLGGIYYLGTKYGDHIGEILLAVLVIVLILLFCSGWKDSGRAVGHWIDYWKDGGDKRDRH